MAPTFQAKGVTRSSQVGSLTVGWPTHQSGDIGLLVIETDAAASAIGTITDWTELSTLSVGSGASGTRLATYWRRATSAAEAAASVPDTGDHQVACIYTFRGCVAGGSPFNFSDTGSKSIASTSTQWGNTGVNGPIITTTQADTLIVLVVARPDDDISTSFFGLPSHTPVNGSVTGIGSGGEAAATDGNGGGFALFYGTYANSGNAGIFTSTRATSSIDAKAAYALRPPANYVLTASGGTFTRSNADATLRRGRRLVADLGTRSLSGQAAGLTYARRLAADTGLFNESGSDAGLLVSRTLPAENGTYGLFLVAAVLQGPTGPIVGGGPGLYALAGGAASLLRGGQVGADGAIYAATTPDADLILGFGVEGEGATYLADFPEAGLSVGLTPPSPVLGLTTGSSYLVGGPTDATRQQEELRQAYTPLEPTYPSALRYQYVRYNGINKSRDLGQADNQTTEISGKVGGFSGSHTLFFRLQTHLPSRLGIDELVDNAQANRWLELGLLDGNHKPLSLDERGFAVPPLEGYSEPFDGVPAMPPGEYIFTVSSSQWAAVPFRIRLTVLAYVSPVGAADLLLPVEGRLALAKLEGLALLESPDEGVLVPRSQLRRPDGTAILSLEATAPYVSTWRGEAVLTLEATGRFSQNYRIEGLAEGQLQGSATLTVITPYGGGGY